MQSPSGATPKRSKFLRAGIAADSPFLDAQQEPAGDIGGHLSDTQ